MTQSQTIRFSEETWKPILETLLAKAKASGADFCEFFLEHKRYLRCLVENGRVTDVAPSLTLGAGVRVFVGEQDAYASSTDLSQKGLAHCLDSALAMAGLNPVKNNSHQATPVSILKPLRKLPQNKTNWLEKCPDIKGVSGFLLKANQTLKQKAQKSESIATSYFRDWQEIMVASSDGTFATDVRLTQSMGSNLLCVDGAHRTSVHERAGKTGVPQYFETYDYAPVADDLAQSAGTMLHADFVQSGKYPVVMANHFGGVIFHEACGHLLETTQIQRKTSPFVDSMGKQIAHTAVTAIDEGLTDSEFGTLDIDDEGMPVEKTVLIEKGILKRFISDRAGEKLTGHQRTGSGRRQDYTFPPASRMRNTFIEAGPHSKQDLISSIDRGLYCKRMGGGSVGATGSFNFAVDEAYWIENGKLTKPLKGAILIGEAVDVLKNISMCANDRSLAPGFCGSVSGTIYVTVGQPHLKVDSITVGGR